MSVCFGTCMLYSTGARIHMRVRMCVRVYVCVCVCVTLCVCVCVCVRDAVRKDRLMYPPSRGELVHLVFEAGDRPSEETMAVVRSWGLDLHPENCNSVLRGSSTSPPSTCSGI